MALFYYPAFDAVFIDENGFRHPLPSTTFDVDNLTDPGSLGTVSSDAFGVVAAGSFDDGFYGVAEGDVIEISHGTYPGKLRFVLQATAAAAFESALNDGATLVAENNFTDTIEPELIGIYLQDKDEPGTPPVAVATGKQGETVRIPYQTAIDKEVRLYLVPISTKFQFSAGDFQESPFDDLNIPALTPGISIGGPVIGGGPNRVLFQDASSNLSTSANFTFNGSNLSLGAGSFVANADDAGISVGGGYGYFRKIPGTACALYSFGSLNIGSASMIDLQGAVRLSADFSSYIEFSGSGTPSIQFRHLGSTGGALLQNVNAGWVIRQFSTQTGNPWRLEDSGGNQLSAFAPGGALGLGVTAGLTAKLQIRSTSTQLQAEYDASNYFSLSVASKGIVTFDAIGSEPSFVFADDVAIADGKNLVAGTTAGLKIGTDSAEKLGFFGATPVTQRTNIGALTDSTGGSIGSIIDDPTGGSDTVDVGIVNNNFASLADRINKIEQVLQDLGLTA